MVRVSCSAVCCCWFWMFICVLTKSFNLLIFHNGQRISNASNAICLHSDCIHWRLRMEKEKNETENTMQRQTLLTWTLVYCLCVVHTKLARNDKRVEGGSGSFFLKFSTSSPFATVALINKERTLHIRSHSLSLFVCITFFYRLHICIFSVWWNLFRKWFIFQCATV